ncbi:sugar/nucleoside kinase (ribokinase family) [Propionicimonas paludicola]|uniref:Sugar/nucleoside kinase (Ribokinase family) n=1 Tax=Propionicimonas paludicola TaxID=185243 RepID=A0A2A9CTJ3_9ACTN|nr:PfkB family carbohydrate kinase [Propionicimonas paludicola]PFG17698.1 sugar/nucleoside kinase (ribokinase family) [Propionicimonas paludicola]
MSAPTGWFVGLATLDVVQRVDGVPAPNQKVVATDTWLAAGGPAANAAIAFAALGGRPVLWTAIGHGSAADVVRADLAGAGVEVIDAAPPGFELTASCVLVDSATGDRIVVSGSAHQPDFPTLPAPELGRAQVLLVDGHHPALALPAARFANERGLPIVVDAGSHKPSFDELFPLASDVLCSADYVHPGGLDASALLALGPQLISVSHGAQPLQWWTATATGQVVPDSIRAADTLGAGDVLHGAYAYALAAGLPRTQALALAVAAASTRVASIGPFVWRSALHSLLS